MRPGRLWISGLRSYRRPIEIDFSGVGLMAIVGDTGAGKSSLLEAITYALYNGTSWNHRDVRPLISDGCQTMSVELDFGALGRVYRVTRSTSRTSYPAPVHRLVCLSDASIATLDKDETVSPEIERLVGMDYKGFLAAVILPQGRFQTLLVASAAERTKILKGIFRLDEIDQVRLIADACCEECRPLLQARVKERSRYRPDPAGEAARAEAEVREHEQVEKQLNRLSAGVKTRLDAAQRARTDAAGMEERTELLKGATRGSADILRKLLPASEEITRKQGVASGRRENLIQREQELERDLSAAGEAGVGLDNLKAALATVEAADRTLQAVAERREELARDAAELEAAEAVVGGLQSRLPGLEAAALEAARVQEDAERLYHSAQGDWQRAHEVLREVRRWEAVIAGERERLLERREALTRKQQQDLVVAEERARLHQGELEQAQAHLVEVVRACAVNVAARGLSTGDPCPICQRTLPPEFLPSPAMDEGPARDAAARADEAARQAGKQLARVQAEVGEEDRGIGAEEDRIERSQGQQDQQLAELAHLVPGLVLQKPDDELLAPLVARGKELKEQVDEAKERTLEVNTSKTTAESEARVKAEALASQRNELDRRRTQADRDEEHVIDELSKIPSLYAPDLVKDKAFDIARGDLQRDLSVLGEKTDQLEGVRRETRVVDEDLARLGHRLRVEVETPRQMAVRDLDALRPRVDDCLRLLGKDGFADVPAAPTLQVLTEWATSLEEKAAEVTIMVQERLDALRQKESDANGEATNLLREHGYTSGEELENARVQAKAEVLAARREAEAARAEIEPATDLDGRIELGERFIVNFEELGRLLTDGQFIGHLIERRQTNLLAVASEILGSMTGQRYRFSADFQVVDRVSNQPRPTRTLSGGESFLASLALALGLVEMAARAGGKLDALFLDEGFGSLDTNSLDEAMSALERRASSGQLVAVVSHIRAVAERIETVLRVTRTPLGSDVSFIDGTERESYMEDVVEVGLLA